ncbi:histidine phosphatase family protein [Halomonas sp. M4R1S46]|uniref:histidine phosphatase family protein n=1 Tax=Halomonas sp. M4R1S46 TaxID=2982692 RepID=UPI0021E3CE34|nr:histidine phosphatase family protein [Halomonas sp. M4R1S46]UYG07693.1 histidine phosphatase family protein [Halomonas sp. M4R1S46]
MTNDAVNAPPRRGNRYLLMRHGHSEANARGIIISTPARGLAHYGLSRRGEDQLAVLLAEWPAPAPSRLLHSDFLRTRDTAERVAGHFGLRPQAEPQLRERHFGDLEGQPDTRYAEVWAQDARDPAHGVHDVESVVRVAARMRAVIDALEARCRGETILLVGHGDPLQILLTSLEGRPLGEHRDRPPLAPASLTALD